MPDEKATAVTVGAYYLKTLYALRDIVGSVKVVAEDLGKVKLADEESRVALLTALDHLSEVVSVIDQVSKDVPPWLPELEPELQRHLKPLP